MACENKISYHVASGYSYKEVKIQCGTTDVYGGRALCDTCQNNSIKRAEHERIMENSEADNAWLKSASWGEI